MAATAGTDGAAPCEVIGPDDFVEVHGLTSEKGKLLNGRRGAVLRCVEASGRLEVCVAPTEVASLKPENLRRLGEVERFEGLERALLEALEERGARGRLERLRGEAADRAAFEAALEPLLVQLQGAAYWQHGADPEGRRRFREGAGAGSEALRRSALRIQELCAFGALGPASLERGEALEVAGLESAGGRALNGLLVRLLSWDAERERYLVALVRDSCQTKAIRPENLRRVAERPFSAGSEAREFQRVLRQAHTLPAAMGSLEELLKAPVALGALGDAALAIQRPVLESFGFRGDLVGQHQLLRAAAAFETDAGLCQDAAAPLECYSPKPMAANGASAGTVVFLDVDGVLHSLYGADIFKESCCALLQQILLSTGAAIVLSSTWRTEESKVQMINDMLQRRRLPPIRDRTRDLGTHREVEICEWLDLHPEVARWIAIDDQDLESRETESAMRLRGHFVRTDKSRGLSMLDAPLAISLLLAQSVEVPASYLVRCFALADFEALASALRYDPGGGGGLRGLSAAEWPQLRQLYTSCRASLAAFHELAMACGVGPELERALAERRHDSTLALARLVASEEFEDQVLGLWFDPGDGGGERSLTAAEADALRQLGKACRREAALVASDGRLLREVAESCGMAPALVRALTELLARDRAARVSQTPGSAV